MPCRVPSAVALAIATTLIAPAVSQAARMIAPANGATVGTSPSFTVALAANESSPLVQIGTQPQLQGSGFANGRIDICGPTGSSGSSLTCQIADSLAPGTYYWLLDYYRNDRCVKVGGTKLCLPSLYVAGPFRFTVSDGTQPPPTPAPTPAPAPTPSPTPLPPTPPPPGGAVAGTAVAGGSLGRPTDGGDIAWHGTEAPPVYGARAVVHYVTTGLDAPPLNDDNGDGVPDYVAQVAAAADRALAFYAGRGFRLPLPDTAGPDNRVDIYIEHMSTPDLFGFAVPPAQGKGGSFVVISSRLDQSPKLARGSLDETVAHELFHVIQFAYTPRQVLPSWVAEGSASAMEMIVYPTISDEVTSEYLDLWLGQPWRSLYDEHSYCDHCYGGAWWWSFLDSVDHKLLPAYFARLAGDHRPRAAIVDLDAALRTRDFGSLADTFGSFAIALYLSGLRPQTSPPLQTLASSQTSRLRLQGLSIHYIPLRLQAGTRSLDIRFAAPGAGRIALVLGGPKGRVVQARGSGRFHVLLRPNELHHAPMLILANGQPDTASYRITTGS